MAASLWLVWFHWQAEWVGGDYGEGAVAECVF